MLQNPSLNFRSGQSLSLLAATYENLLYSKLSKTSREHAVKFKELEERAESAEAERIFTELELNNAQSERDAALQRVEVLEAAHEGASVLHVPIASVSDVGPEDLSQKLKAAHKEVRRTV
jgi:hypothetical protein